MNERTSAAVAWMRRTGRYLTVLAGAVATFGLAGSAHAGLTFSNSYTGFSAGFLGTTQTAVNTAESQLSGLFTNNVNVTISFEATGATGLADSSFDTANFPSPFGGGTSNFSYAQIKATLAAHSALHPENTALASMLGNLPASPVPCAGCNSSPAHYMLPDPESLALTGSHVPGGAGYPFQGYIRLNPGFSYDNDPSDGIGLGQLDLVAVMLHEITHVMGRVDFSFCGGPGGCGGAINSDPWLTVLDLGRYNCGSTTRNTVAANACFSVDGGVTDLRGFSSTSDTGDWDSGMVSANNAFINFGTVMPLLMSDILTMNALGWDPAVGGRTPEPGTVVLLGLGLLGLGAMRRRR